ncbi:hypothetical protein CDCA_CDCA02G0604 [Cyanidium caldarium]|uniref:Uncharacterized protein n=1 Tax=Cyanidium caldarium TaxID=2771 RepID=A0AAV9IQQ0_CYACA|nr:hypothetical protein CDCA_CDCA02G0604 [Cyanidium caldarium]
MPRLVQTALTEYAFLAGEPEGRLAVPTERLEWAASSRTGALDWPAMGSYRLDFEHGRDNGLRQDQLRVIVDELQPLVPSARRAQRQWSDRAPPTDEEDRRGAGARRRLRRVGAPADNDGDAALWCLPPELLSPRMRDVWRRRLDDAIGRMQALVRTTAGVTRAGADGARSGAAPHKRPRTSLGPLRSAAVSTESKPVPTRDEDTDAARDEPEEHHDEDEVRQPARPRRVKTEESDDGNAVTSSAETSASELEFEKVDDDEEYDDSLASDAEHEPVY